MVLPRGLAAGGPATWVVEPLTLQEGLGHSRAVEAPGEELLQTPQCGGVLPRGMLGSGPPA